MRSGQPGTLPRAGRTLAHGVARADRWSRRDEHRGPGFSGGEWPAGAWRLCPRHLRVPGVERLFHARPHRKGPARDLGPACERRGCAPEARATEVRAPVTWGPAPRTPPSRQSRGSGAPARGSDCPCPDSRRLLGHRTRGVPWLSPRPAGRQTADRPVRPSVATPRPPPQPQMMSGAARGRQLTSSPPTRRAGGR